MLYTFRKTTIKNDYQRDKIKEVEIRLPSDGFQFTWFVIRFESGMWTTHLMDE